MRTMAQQKRHAEKEAAKWNARYPVGTCVRYYPAKGSPEFKEVVTTTPASVLGGHSAVVWVTGITGCVFLDNCEPWIEDENADGDAILRPAASPSFH